MAKNYPETPDGRYFVSRSRLWRKTNPALQDSTRRKLIKQLMQARRALQTSTNNEETDVARKSVHEAKLALGERGPVWWDDGAPDETEKHPEKSSYGEWWAGLPPDMRAKGE